LLAIVTSLLAGWWFRLILARGLDLMSVTQKSAEATGEEQSSLHGPTKTKRFG
jgi:hypothetical protein